MMVGAMAHWDFLRLCSARIDLDGSGTVNIDDENAIDSGRLDWIWDGDLLAQGYTESDLSTIARVLSRPCPHCGAELGAWCRTTGKGVELTHLDEQHVARRRPWATGER